MDCSTSSQSSHLSGCLKGIRKQRESHYSTKSLTKSHTHTHTHIHRIFFLNPGGRFPPLRYRGGWLLTSPEEDFDKMQGMAHFQLPLETSDTGSHTNLPHATKTKAKNQLSQMHTAC